MSVFVSHLSFQGPDLRDLQKTDLDVLLYRVRLKLLDLHFLGNYPSKFNSYSFHGWGEAWRVDSWRPQKFYSNAYVSIYSFPTCHSFYSSSASLFNLCPIFCMPDYLFMMSVGNRGFTLSAIHVVWRSSVLSVSQFEPNLKNGFLSLANLLSQSLHKIPLPISLFPWRCNKFPVPIPAFDFSNVASTLFNDEVFFVYQSGSLRNYCSLKLCLYYDT